MKTSLDNESINYLKDDISKLTREIVERQRNSRIQEQMEVGMEKFLPKEGEVITDEAIHKLSNYLANELVNDLYRIDRKENYVLNLENL